MSYLIDTNVLLRVQDEGNPHHEQCTSAIDILKSRDEPLFVCAQVLAEFWVVLTRPRDVNGWGFAFDAAVIEIVKVRSTFRCLAEPTDMADRWQRVVMENKAMGKQAHDARLAALMLAHGVIHILTLNVSDFARYQGIVPVSPSEVLNA